MTQEFLGRKEAGSAAECCADTRLVLKEGKKQNEMVKSFQKQQANNLQMKEKLARELADMELPELMVHQILNIKD